MASFNKFQSFVTAAVAGTHVNALNASTDTLKVYLSNTAPDAAVMALKADLAEIAAGNGYPSGGASTTNSASTSAGLIAVVGTDIVFTASGGPVGPFRYAVLYNNNPTGKPLIGWWDYGSSITLLDTETFTVDFGVAMFTIG